MKKLNNNNFGYLLSRSFKVIKKNGIHTFIKKLFKFAFSSNKIDLDNFVIDKESTLDDFFLKFGTYKGSLDGKKTYDVLFKNSKKEEFKNYLDWINRKNPRNYDYQLGFNLAPIYSRFFSARRTEKLKILEIGVANGHSVASLHHYFPNSIIYGIDIKRPYKFFYKSKRVKYFDIDIFDEKKIKKFIEQNGKFDFIIDDSQQHMDDEEHAMLTNIVNFYPALNPKGIYFLENSRFVDNIKEINVKYNLQNNHKWLGSNSLTVRDIFKNINDKKMFDHEMINKSTLEYIIDTTEKAEIIYQDHPWAAIAVLQKK